MSGLVTRALPVGLTAIIVSGNISGVSEVAQGGGVAPGRSRREAKNSRTKIFYDLTSTKVMVKFAE